MGEYLISLEPVVLVVHYAAIVVLLIAILLQSGKGMNMGSMFGAGGSQSLFGARGAGNFLTKTTTLAAIVLLATSLGLAALSNSKATGGGSVIGHEETVTAPTPPPADTPPAPNAGQ